MIGYGFTPNTISYNRSKTKLTANILKEAKKLQVIGCFCIGTNQVDLGQASAQGVNSIN